MSHRPTDLPPADICLLLRAHFEDVWLRTQVLPIVRQLEQPDSIPEDQLGAALAYLELLWIDAARRAAETETAFRELLCSRANPDPFVQAHARRLHAAVRLVRGHIARRVARLTAAPEEPHGHEPAATRPDRIACGADGPSFRPAVALDPLRRRAVRSRGRTSRGAGRR